MKSKTELDRFLAKIQKYRFEIRHLTLLFVILIVFQLLLSYIQKNSLEEFLTDTQSWYQKDSAERIANLTSTSLELLIENIPREKNFTETQSKKIIESFNIIFSQQLLDQHVEEVCLIISKSDHELVIDDGEELFNYLVSNTGSKSNNLQSHGNALNFYLEHENSMRVNEEIFSLLSKEDNAFHILVPFVPHGEYLGAFFMKNHPDFTIITKEIIVSYDEATVIYSSFILLGLLAMYYISSYTVRERDEAQRLLFEEHEENIKKQVRHEKESLFTKRIYHTHHKAEKVMGFIKEDLRELNENNIEEIKERVKKYSNFISRVIYDMKWYDPPMSTIRGDLFRTDINSVIKFLINNLFLRITTSTELFKFELNFDSATPPVRVNEFVIWEVIEPLIQNSIDHSGNKNVKVTINTKYFETEHYTLLEIIDDGPGIDASLLEADEKGVKKLFREDISTKNLKNKNSGYGCYIAYNIAVSKCGWKLDVENNPDKGCKYSIIIQN
ncbi:MAG: hypothetical protein SCALA702_22230 [Melioribacteraceae bacterium]|nr:MAG: hypothetical protein SCALA702_22230 [Melioribacteraceae bacterium]